MRLLLIIMGAFVAIVCLAKPTEARDYPWCAYYNSQHGGAANCGKMRHLIFQIFTLGSFKKTTVAYREIDGQQDSSGRISSSGYNNSAGDCLDSRRRIDNGQP